MVDRAVAARSGLGLYGKNTNILTKRWGSWVFLSELVTSLDLEPDAPVGASCGRCEICLHACPTDAFVAPYVLDNRRCISYLTIELRGSIPLELRPLIGNRIFGCDDCLAVCPWNKFAKAGHEPAFLPRAELTAPHLAELARLDDAGFRAMFAGTSVKRTGRNRFLRTVLTAIGNAPEPTPDLVAAARHCLDDASPLVRGAAAWALGRIAKPRDLATDMEARLTREPDAEVRAEWQRLAAAAAPN